MELNYNWLDILNIVATVFSLVVVPILLVWLNKKIERKSVVEKAKFDKAFESYQKLWVRTASLISSVNYLETLPDLYSEFNQNHTELEGYLNSISPFISRKIFKSCGELLILIQEVWNAFSIDGRPESDLLIARNKFKVKAEIISRLIEMEI